MLIELSAEQAKFVNDEVAAKHYNSAEEVIAVALQVINWNDPCKQVLRQKIKEGLASAKRGKLLDGEEVFTELLADLTDEEETAK